MSDAAFFLLAAALSALKKTDLHGHPKRFLFVGNFWAALDKS
ncbi:MAG: hypothetical protein WCE73_00020 [Candidatus Angelobacter sp.]